MDVKITTFYFLPILAVLWGLGNIILKPLGILNNKKPFFQLFLSLLTGIATFGFIYAIIITKGRTINQLLLLIKAKAFFSQH